MYWDASSLYGWVMPQKLPAENFGWEKTSKFDEKFVKNCGDNSDKRYIFAVEAEYSKQLRDSDNDLIFLPESIKIKKCQKLVCNLYGKEKYVVHIRTLKQALNHAILEKLNRIIKFNQTAWLNPYINMNNKLRTEAKNDFEKDFFKVFGKTVDNVRKYHDSLLITEKNEVI